MPRRSPVGLDEIASLDTLAAAFHAAARGKPCSQEVAAFRADLEGNLLALAADLRAGRAPEGRYRLFHIRDPKPRAIAAPCFRDRVLHHAMMMHMGPVLERGLVDDTFACRPGKGTLAAVRRVQEHLRRSPVWVKVDVRAYFSSIRHDRLLDILARKFKNQALLALCARILATAPIAGNLPSTIARQAGGVVASVGRQAGGVPIGALTSQHFANSYLDAADRYLLAAPEVRGMVRYMDDIVVFCDTPAQGRAVVERLRIFLDEALGLTLRPDVRVGRSVDGVPFLGFRVLRGTLRLSRRRRRRFAATRARWEQRALRGDIDGRGLQAGYAAARAITAHADAASFHREQLRRSPPPDCL